jgi:hypothetical protein
MTEWQYVNPGEFDRAFSDDADIVEFVSEAEETDYEKHDSFLIELIKQVCSSVLDDSADVHTHHLEDWWPNRTRYLYVSSEFCTQQLLAKLHGLLTDEFAAYRIQVLVNEDLTLDSGREIGALVIYADRIVVEHDVATRCGLDGRTT